jgi:hypothetical protein
MKSAAALEAERQAGWRRFAAAAEAAQRGDYTLARALVEQVRQAAGEAAAQRQRRELWNYVNYLRQQRALDIPNRRVKSSA